MTSEVAPASLQQTALLHALDSLPSSTAAYNLAGGVRFRRQADAALLRRGLHAIVQRHETLRTTLERSGDTFLQRIHRRGDLAWAEHDHRDVPAERRAALIREHAMSESRSPVDLADVRRLRVRLLRFADDDLALVIGTHHVGFDGHSATLLWAELWAWYGVAAGLPVDDPLPHLPYQYRDYAAWQREPANAVIEEDLAYWHAHLPRPLPRLDLPFGPAPDAGDLVVPPRVQIGLDAERRRELQERSRQLGVSVFALIVAGLALQLWQATGQEEIVVGTPTASRRDPRFGGLIGFFANVVLLRLEVRPMERFRDVALRVGRRLLEATAHDAAYITQVLERVAPGRGTTVDISISDRLSGRSPRSDFSPVEIVEGIDVVPMRGELRYQVLSTGPGIELTMDYRAGALSPAGAGRWLDGLLAAIDSGTRDPDLPLCRLEAGAPTRLG